jgi:hypothetical protein
VLVTRIGTELASRPPRLLLAAGLALIASLPSVSCGTGATSPTDAAVTEKRCGDSPDVYVFVSGAEQLAEFSDCTVLVGRLQADSVRELEDLSALRNVTRIEGLLNVFRSPGFLTLHGLENLEVVEGDVFIHLNPNLTSIAALGKLRSVTGDLGIFGNDRLPQTEVEAVAAGIAVGGTTTLMQAPAP